MDNKISINKKRYYNLDFIKALSSILIVLHHYQQLADVRFNGINFFGGSFYFGYLVELFFMISGFVMAASDKKEKTILQKYMGKCVRIYPGAMLACSAMIIIVYVGYIATGEWIDITTDYTNIVTIISSYLLVFNGWFLDIGLGINNPTWYLCVLLLCYIIYYLIEIVSKKLSISKAVSYFLIFIISFCGMYFRKTLPYFFTIQNQRGYTCFFLGVLLYHFFVKKFSDKQKAFATVVLIVLAVMGIWYWGVGSWIALDLFVYPALICFLVKIKQLPSSIGILGGGDI